MPYTYNIKIDGKRLSDTCIKVIVLLIYGLGYNGMALVLGGKPKTYRNIVSDLNGSLDTEEHGGIIRKAHADGFGYNGHVNGVDVLDPYERKRLFEKFPKLKDEKPLPDHVY